MLDENGYQGDKNTKEQALKMTVPINNPEIRPI
jgi:hypothetical protein